MAETDSAAEMMAWFSRWQEEFRRDQEAGGTDLAQSQPSYWTIMDHRWISAPLESAEETRWWNSDACSYVDLEDEAYERFGDVGDIDPSTGFEREYDGAVRIIDEFDAARTAESVFHLEMVGVQRIDVERGIFMTRKEAERHLSLNHYHYAADAYVYYEHAFRSPDVERLWKFLRCLDLQDSTIVLDMDKEKEVYWG